MENLRQDSMALAMLREQLKTNAPSLDSPPGFYADTNNSLVFELQHARSGVAVVSAMGHGRQRRCQEQRPRHFPEDLRRLPSTGRRGQGRRRAAAGRFGVGEGAERRAIGAHRFERPQRADPGARQDLEPGHAALARESG
jgi:hypothetical protein